MNKRRIIGASVLAWVLLHFYTSFTTFFESWYKTYTGRSWILLGVWLLGLLALDVCLVFGGAELLRSLKWYWGFSAGLYGVILLGTLLDWSFPDLAAFVVVLSSFLTPFHQLTAFNWLLFGETAGFGRRTLSYLQCSGGLLFCLVHFAYIAWLHHRTRKGETA